MEKSFFTPQQTGAATLGNSRQRSFDCAACGKIRPLTLPPQIKPSSQPESWSSSRSNSAGQSVFNAASARA